MHLHYLPDWPKVPDHLLDDVQRIIEKNPDELDRFVGHAYSPYTLHAIDGALAEWLRANVPLEFGSCFHIHVIRNDLVIHQDFMDEQYKVNYIFQLGGPEVKTNFYDKDHRLLESHCVQTHTWHWFDGTVPHNASNLAPGEIRIAITLGVKKVI